jgi:hypothetical protein
MLDENSLIEAIQELKEAPQWEAMFDFSESAGIAQICCSLELTETEKLLDSYYHRGEV